MAHNESEETPLNDPLLEKFIDQLGLVVRQTILLRVQLYERLRVTDHPEYPVEPITEPFSLHVHEGKVSDAGVDLGRQTDPLGSTGPFDIGTVAIGHFFGRIRVLFVAAPVLADIVRPIAPVAVRRFENKGVGPRIKHNLANFLARKAHPHRARVHQVVLILKLKCLFVLKLAMVGTWLTNLPELFRYLIHTAPTFYRFGTQPCRESG